MNPTHIHTLLLLLAAIAIVVRLSAAHMADMQWNPSSGHISAPLSDWVQKHPILEGFIADEIANVKTVQHEADKYWFMLSAGLLDHTDKVGRAAGGESNKVAMAWTTGSYQCSEKALHDDLPWSTRDNADSQLGIEQEAVMLPREGVLLAKEKAAAAILFSTTYITNNGQAGTLDGGGAAAWDGTAANVLFWSDLIGASYIVSKFGGAAADNVAMGAKTWKVVASWLMKQSATPAGVRWRGITELLKENPQAAPVSLMDLRLLVGRAMYSSAVRPEDISRAASGGNITEVWNGSALVFHKGTLGLKTIALAARYMKSGWPRVRQGTYSGPRECDWFEYSENESGVKIVAASCGYLITSANT